MLTGKQVNSSDTAYYNKRVLCIVNVPASYHTQNCIIILHASFIALARMITETGGKEADLAL
jgi:hypothetical protein